MSRILCVDDDESVVRLVAKVVEFCHHEPLVVTDSFAAVEALRDQTVKAVLADYMMPKLNGIELLLVCQEQRPDVRRVLITAAPQEAKVREARTSGLLQMVIAKPPNIADIELALAWL